MPIDPRSIEVAALFSTQMLVHIVRNLVAAGWSENGMRTNLQETIDTAEQNFPAPEYHRYIVDLAKAFEQAIQEGAAYRDK